mmetsp:Transcript_16855/g.27882  ORF Transcript_16855/g.27882 Transcript_16855/m.27882 type:complete len:236 (+) Transcript_16855:1504-2211(+)
MYRNSHPRANTLGQSLAKDHTYSWSCFSDIPGIGVEARAVAEGVGGVDCCDLDWVDCFAPAPLGIPAVGLVVEAPPMTSWPISNTRRRSVNRLSALARASEVFSSVLGRGGRGTGRRLIAGSNPGGLAEASCRESEMRGICARAKAMLFLADSTLLRGRLSSCIYRDSIALRYRMRAVSASSNDSSMPNLVLMSVSSFFPFGVPSTTETSEEDFILLVSVSLLFGLSGEFDVVPR